MKQKGAGNIRKENTSHLMLYLPYIDSMDLHIRINSYLNIIFLLLYLIPTLFVNAMHLFKQTLRILLLNICQAGSLCLHQVTFSLDKYYYYYFILFFNFLFSEHFSHWVLGQREQCAMNMRSYMIIKSHFDQLIQKPPNYVLVHCM